MGDLRSSGIRLGRPLHLSEPAILARGTRSVDPLGPLDTFLAGFMSEFLLNVGKVSVFSAALGTVNDAVGLDLLRHENLPSPALWARVNTPSDHDWPVIGWIIPQRAKRAA